MGLSQKRQEVLIGSAHQLGRYVYVTRWTFRDDGSFEPEIGFTGTDVVVWYVAHFQHLHREEDVLYMPMEVVGLDLHPRGWRHKSTLEP